MIKIDASLIFIQKQVSELSDLDSPGFRICVPTFSQNIVDVLVNMNFFIHLGDITVELVAFVYVKTAIENGHRKFVSFPMKSMVDRSIVVCMLTRW